MLARAECYTRSTQVVWTATGEKPSARLTLRIASLCSPLVVVTRPTSKLQERAHLALRVHPANRGGEQNARFGRMSSDQQLRAVSARPCPHGVEQRRPGSSSTAVRMHEDLHSARWRAWGDGQLGEADALACLLRGPVLAGLELRRMSQERFHLAA